MLATGAPWDGGLEQLWRLANFMRFEYTVDVTMREANFGTDLTEGEPLLPKRPHLAGDFRIGVSKPNSALFL